MQQEEAAEKAGEGFNAWLISLRLLIGLLPGA